VSDDPSIPSAVRRAPRFVGWLFCRQCHHELAPVFADEQGETFLPVWGGERLKQALIVCRCGGVRSFRGVPVSRLTAAAHPPYNSLE
jgi:hypothetical protein